MSWCEGRLDFANADVQRLEQELRIAYPSRKRIEHLVDGVALFPRDDVDWEVNTSLLWRSVMRESARAAVLKDLIDAVLRDPATRAHHPLILQVVGDLDSEIPATSSDDSYGANVTRLDDFRANLPYKQPESALDNTALQERLVGRNLVTNIEGVVRIARELISTNNPRPLLVSRLQGSCRELQATIRQSSAVMSPIINPPRSHLWTEVLSRVSTETQVFDRTLISRQGARICSADVLTQAATNLAAAASDIERILSQLSLSD
jgi:hypothetical protein